MTSLERSARAQAYSAEYGDALADHLPMALSALARMGAEPERRAAFARAYVSAKALRRLDELDVESMERASMRARIAIHGRSPLLRDEIGTLARGIGAGAFHALIRVAYGIVDGDDGEIAAGLTYWHRAALDLGDASRLPPDGERFRAPAALARARTLLAHVPSGLRSHDLIARRMAAVSHDDAFDAAAGHPRFGEDSLVQIAALTVRAFAATRNFTLLHAMTATHALRIVLPFAADRDALLQFFWRAYVAAYVSAGAPAVPDDTAFASELARVPAWPDLHTLACASDDEHVIKAVFTAWTEDAVYRDPFYRLAAARYMRLPA